MGTSAASARAQDAVANCERDHSAAILALASAEAGLDNATQAYTASLGQGRDAARAARQLRNDAEVDRDIARDAVERLANQLHAAREAAGAAEIERLTTEAQAKCSEFQVAARREIKVMTTAGRRLVRLLAEAQIARATALQAGAEDVDLPEVEGFRNVPGLPREVIETKRVTRWIHPFNGRPLSDEQQQRVKLSGTDAYLTGASTGPLELKRQAVFDRIVYLEAQRPRRSTSLLESMLLPGLMADDVPGWESPEVLTPHALLARLDALEGAGPPDRSDLRERQVELIRVPDHELGIDPASLERVSAA